MRSFRLRSVPQAVGESALVLWVRDYFWLVMIHVLAIEKILGNQQSVWEIVRFKDIG